MGVILVQVALDRDSMLPEDCACNTFHFDTGAAAITPLLGLEACGRCLDFYTVTPGGTTGAPRSFLSKYMTGGGIAKAYAVGGAPPNLPIASIPLSPGGTGTTGLPSEVAITVSYHAALVSGAPVNRRKGRIYFGPCSEQCSVQPATGSDARVGDFVSDSLRGASIALSQANTTTLKWAVYSRVDLVAREITGGHVDNSFDTQRRRGAAPTTRNTWGSAS